MTAAQRQRVAKLKEMHKIMLNISNEDYYFDWIVWGVPDEPSEDDYEFLAETPERYNEVSECFARLFILAVMNNDVKLVY